MKGFAAQPTERRRKGDRNLRFNCALLSGTNPSEAFLSLAPGNTGAILQTEQHRKISPSVLVSDGFESSAKHAYTQSECVTKGPANARRLALNWP